MGQSWEDIANEIAPAELQPRGLATGARRGPGVAYPPSETDATGTGWLSAPSEPRCIPAPRARPDALRDEVLGGSLKANAYGSYYHMARSPLDFDAAYGTLPQRLEKVLKAERFAALSGTELQELVFVDIETTGLSSSAPLFLIGALWFDDNRQGKLDLFLALDVAQEASALCAYHALAEGKTLLTFNGKNFDWPYIEARSLRHRVRFGEPSAHVDVLHIARRAWKSRTPNCRLQTLETHICGRARIDDIPSSRIPATYENYLERRNREQSTLSPQSTLGRAAAMLSPIVHHNALDILTMAELLCLASEKRTWHDFTPQDSYPQGDR